MQKIEVSLAALDTLTRMVEELEKDAARYRWLRENNCRYLSGQSDPKVLDENIDAEMNG